MSKFKNMRFKLIETFGLLPDGRMITSYQSYPLGVGYERYMEIDEALCNAYGSRNCRIVGTPLEVYEYGS